MEADDVGVRWFCGTNSRVEREIILYEHSEIRPNCYRLRMENGSDKARMSYQLW